MADFISSLFSASLFAILVYLSGIISNCFFPRFLTDHTPHSELWWTDFGLQHSVTSQFIVANKLRRALSHEPFDLNAAQYGWNQLVYDASSGQFQLLQLCPSTKLHGKTFRPVLSALNQFTQTKCTDTRNGVHQEREIGAPQQAQISLLRVNLTCVDQVVQFEGTRFLMHITDFMHP